MLYDAPANVFVADFLGDSNLLPVTVVGDSADDPSGGDRGAARRGGTPKRGAAQPRRRQAVVLIRPEDIVLTPRPRTVTGQDTLAGTVRTSAITAIPSGLTLPVGAGHAEDQGSACRRCWV